MKKVRLFIVLAGIMFIRINSFAQLEVESLFGHKGLEFASIYQRNFSVNSSFSYYGVLDIQCSWDDIGNSQFDFYQTVSYEVIKNAGISFGNSFTNDDILPHFGVYWGIENSLMEISIVPSFTYSLNYGLKGFDLDLYFEKYWGKTEKWYPFTFLILNGGSFSDDYREMSALGCVGMSYKKKVQLGIGSGITTTSDDEKPFYNFGLFGSYKFD